MQSPLDDAVAAEALVDASPAEPITEEQKREALALLFAIFIIAACGLVYELLIATVSSYLLGSSVTQFSIAIGVFIGSMGVGSHLSSYVSRRLLETFVAIEIALAVCGALSVPLLFWSYAHGALYWAVLYASLFVIGSLTGLELPILTRLLKPYGSLRDVIARALSFDYIGALLGSLAFPLLLLPTLGLMRTAFAVGALNLGVALWIVWTFRKRLPLARPTMAFGGAVAVVLAAGFVWSLQLLSFLERDLYEDEIIFARQTPYQRIVVTRWREDTRLFLDGNLQFSTTDEYRYHEALVHPAMSLAKAGKPGRVLILGGGDGLGVREVLKYPSVKEVVLIDLDPQMTKLGREYPAIVEANKGAMSDKRLKVVHQDAHKYLEAGAGLFDCIIADLPDPNNDVLAKLYSVQFYKLAGRRLSAMGTFVTQATSPFFAREAFWCIARSMEKADLHTAPYHAYVPSFGDWGFVLASAHQLHRERAKISVPCEFLNQATLREMFVLPQDASEVAVDVSTLDRPAILDYYLNNWKQWE
jgi:spermidine synthase